MTIRSPALRDVELVRGLDSDERARVWLREFPDSDMGSATTDTSILIKRGKILHQLRIDLSFQRAKTKSAGNNCSPPLTLKKKAHISRLTIEPCGIDLSLVRACSAPYTATQPYANYTHRRADQWYGEDAQGCSSELRGQNLLCPVPYRKIRQAKCIPSVHIMLPRYVARYSDTRRRTQQVPGSQRLG